MPPPKRVEMGAFYRVLRLMELAAEFGYTTAQTLDVYRQQGGRLAHVNYLVVTNIVHH